MTRRNSNTTNDFPDRKGTVVPKSVLMSISMVLNVFFCSGTYTSGLKTRCMLPIDLSSVSTMQRSGAFVFRLERVPEHRSRRKPNEHVLSDPEDFSTISGNAVYNACCDCNPTDGPDQTELDLYATRCTGEIRHLDFSTVGFIGKFYEKRLLTL